MFVKWRLLVELAREFRLSFIARAKVLYYTLWRSPERFQSIEGRIAILEAHQRASSEAARSHKKLNQ
jgi:hypothetical protein